MPEELKRPASPKASDKKDPAREPWEVNPELAKAKQAGDLIEKMGMPSIVSKKFVVRHGIFKGLNHSEYNPTGYDCSLRVAIYDNVEQKSVNIDGKSFEKIFAYLMQPKYVIQGMPTGPGGFEQQGESVGARILGFFTGRKANDTSSNAR